MFLGQKNLYAFMLTDAVILPVLANNQWLIWRCYFYPCPWQLVISLSFFKLLCSSSSNVSLSGQINVPSPFPIFHQAFLNLTSAFKWPHTIEFNTNLSAQVVRQFPLGTGLSFHSATQCLLSFQFCSKLKWRFPKQFVDHLELQQQYKTGRNVSVSYWLYPSS